MRTGTCRLTGIRGKFVKSHLIPKAVTYPDTKGNRFIQGGQGTRPKKVWSSWYDENLVTQEGEEILSDYDSYAIQELSRLRLIWKSWGPIMSFSDSIVAQHEEFTLGFRKLECHNPDKLRLFFLSLLWRAAATRLPEFEGIQLDKADLRNLRRMVRDGNPHPIDYYPTTLLQIVTRGATHNLSPFTREDAFDFGDGPRQRKVSRFYFDGLIANIHHTIDDLEGVGDFVVGYSNKLVVQTQLYEGSFQSANLIQSVGHSTLRWPEATARAKGNFKSNK